jgi:hypothetical protein
MDSDQRGVQLVICQSTVFSKEFSSRVPGATVFKELTAQIHKSCMERKYSIRVIPSNKGRSSVEWCYNDEDSFGVIEIDSTVSSESHPLDALWDLVHEWGHTMVPPPPVGYKPARNELTYAREEPAWTAGWRMSCEVMPILQGHEMDYRRRQEECLSSYRS